MAYNPQKIEPKWQKYWREEGFFDTPEITGDKKAYILDMFPYPSGTGLHVGHPKGYIATDVFSRYKRMNGYDVLHPMGWDAFGLPAENYAIANKVHPRIAVEENIARFKEQLEIIGFDYDWSREINTTDPNYYKWTQWIFLQLYKRGLAYESHEPINWCPSCQTGLANEDVEAGKCERCGSIVELRPLRQWVLKIREYADTLLEGLEELDWPESIKESQRNWIGRSEGARVRFSVEGHEDLEVYTTRPDTIFGATYMVAAPEHPVVQKLLDSSVVSNKDEVLAYIEEAKNKTELQRKTDEKEKTGVELKGVGVMNPATGKRIPLWVADYVLIGYGTGVIMAVPAHDERDFAFAKKFELPVVQVIDGGDNVLPFTEDGTLVNSGEFNGLSVTDAKEQIVDWLQKQGVAEVAIDYKLRDWTFSRQRYWGEPIPIIHCDECGAVPVPEDHLPVELPEVEHYEPTGTGESPLAAIEDWVHVECPACGAQAKRETNTMPQWAGSSWYYLAYIMRGVSELEFPIQQYKKAFASWLPVDMYVGGAEHATRHLIYARFWHRFLYDEGHVGFPEPFKRLQHVGLIMGEDGKKMSKRSGNVINPDSVVEKYGADTLRVYEMFMGPFDHSVAWSTDSIIGARRFLNRVWDLVESSQVAEADSDDVRLLLHQTIQKVTDSIEGFRFNTAISSLMELLNAVEGGQASRDTLKQFVLLVSPFAPHIAEELWQKLDGGDSVLKQSWPTADLEVVAGAQVTIPIQVNGKVRGELVLDPGKSQEETEMEARAVKNVQKYLEGKEIRKVIYVPDKLINFVVY